MQRNLELAQFTPPWASWSLKCPTLHYRTTSTLNYLLGYELDQHELLLLLFCHEENYVVYMKIITYYCIHAYILFCMKVKSCILWNTILVVQRHTLSKECVRVSTWIHTMKYFLRFIKSTIFIKDIPAFVKFSKHKL